MLLARRRDGETASAIDGRGDFSWTRTAGCSGAASARRAPFVYAGVAILKPAIVR